MGAGASLAPPPPGARLCCAGARTRAAAGFRAVSSRLTSSGAAWASVQASRPASRGSGSPTFLRNSLRVLLRAQRSSLLLRLSLDLWFRSTSQSPRGGRRALLANGPDSSGLGHRFLGFVATCFFGPTSVFPAACCNLSSVYYSEIDFVWGSLSDRLSFFFFPLGEEVVIP